MISLYETSKAMAYTQDSSFIVTGTELSSRSKLKYSAESALGLWETVIIDTFSDNVKSGYNSTLWLNEMMTDSTGKQYIVYTKPNIHCEGGISYPLTVATYNKGNQNEWIKKYNK